MLPEDALARFERGDLRAHLGVELRRVRERSHPWNEDDLVVREPEERRERPARRRRGEERQRARSRTARPARKTQNALRELSDRRRRLVLNALFGPRRDRRQ